MRRGLGSAILVAALTAAGVGLVPAAAHASSAESEFVSLINQARASRGLSSLSVRSDLTSAARKQSGAMASAGSLFHSSSLGSGISGWTKIGENVGTGSTVDKIHDAFMGSSGHRANILESDFNQVGVGVVEKSGTIWVTEIFVERASSSSSSDDDERTAVRSTRTRNTTYSAPIRAAAPPAPKPKPKPKKVQAPARTVNVLLRLLEIDGTR